MFIKNKTQFTENDFIGLNPIPNPYKPGMGFDYGNGSCLMLRYDAETYLAENKLDRDHVWSIIEAENELYIDHGFSYINTLGFMITEKAPRFIPTEPILVD